MAEPIDFRPSPELYPFESRWLESPAGRMHYVDEGSGRPILMCHGNPTWSFIHRHLILALRDRFRCVAVDYLGFGLSERPQSGFGYTPQEQAEVVGQLVRELDLRDMIVMGHDWGGPISLATALADPDRVGGVVLGNTWFWPSPLRVRVFSLVMSSRPLQRAILQRNLFIERFLPAETVRELSEQEMNHYRGVQPSPEARVGMAALPRQLRAARPWLAQLWEAVPRELGAKLALSTYPMRDTAFTPRMVLPRFREAFSDLEVIELPEAKHFFLEDASPEAAAAIARRFA